MFENNQNKIFLIIIFSNSTAEAYCMVFAEKQWWIIVFHGDICPLVEIIEKNNWNSDKLNNNKVIHVMFNPFSYVILWSLMKLYAPIPCHTGTEKCDFFFARRNLQIPWKHVFSVFKFWRKTVFPVVTGKTTANFQNQIKNLFVPLRFYTYHPTSLKLSQVVHLKTLTSP